MSIVTGFSDQSHLVREFSEIFGWPPALVREYLAQIEHVHVEMSRRCLTRPERSVPDLSSLTLGRVPVARITKSALWRGIARSRIDRHNGVDRYSANLIKAHLFGRKTERALDS